MQVLSLNNAGTLPIAFARLAAHERPVNPGHFMHLEREIAGNTRHARSKCMTALPFQHHGTGSIDLHAPRRGSKCRAGRQGAGEKTARATPCHLPHLFRGPETIFENFGVSRD